MLMKHGQKPTPLPGTLCIHPAATLLSCLPLNHHQPNKRRPVSGATARRSAAMCTASSQRAP